ncbi:LapA family protein [Enterococcus asini]|uniref:LapA family protein n=1 Tax=Enterococcus asini TaxID=57732 RepID=UPI00241DCDAC|nr:LapA family protein [Enterococcus asini]
MKRQWRLILLLVLIFVVGLFAAFNSQSVAVNFLFGQVAAPLVLVILISVLAGAVIATLLVTNVLWQQKRRVKTLERQVASLEQNTRQPQLDDQKLPAEKPTDDSNQGQQ